MIVDEWAKQVLGISHEVGDGYDVWVAKVLAEAYGSTQPTEIHLATEEEARQVGVGYKFLG